MIVVIARVQTDAERRERLVEMGQALVLASRRDAGCLAYDLYEDVARENAFVVVEEWESREALDQHFATPHIAAFMGAIGNVVVEPPDVRFHDVASTRGLADVGGRG
jgi:quinol monooxygenase YgiN